MLWQNEDAECELDADEPIMEGSDDQFGEFDDELRDQIEVEMDEKNIVEDCAANESGCDGGYLDVMEEIEEMEEESAEEEETADAVLEAGLDLPTEWSTELKPVTIPVGPTVPIPDTAVTVQSCLFSSPRCSSWWGHDQISGDGITQAMHAPETY